MTVPTKDILGGATRIDKMRRWRAKRNGQCSWCGDITTDLVVWVHGGYSDVGEYHATEWRCVPCATLALEAS